MKRKSYELHGTNEVVVSGSSRGYGRRGVGGRLPHMHFELVQEQEVRKERHRFTTGRSLNQLNSKLQELDCLCAKIQYIFESCKYFLKKACKRQAEREMIRYLMKVLSNCKDTNKI